MIRRFKLIWILIQKRSKNIKLPLFDGLSLYDVTSFFFQGILEGQITNRAASISYSFFIALFPGIIFLFSLIAYVPIDNFDQEVFWLLSIVLPPDTYEAAKTTIDDILVNKRPDLLSVGFLFALFFATNGINALLSNLGNTIHKLENRSFLRQQMVSIGLTVFLSIVFLIGMIIIIFSSDVLNTLLGYINLDSVSTLMVDIVRYVLMIILTLLTIAILYNIGPSKGREWKFISPGAILATVLILLSSFAFSYYISNFSQYNKLYGSIGTLLVILLWIYVNALLLIIGFELNASMASAKYSNKKILELKNNL
tara:strand:- start:129 stop:1061 length:933 start_codon:yes stop_codon:yes gene_type:complete